MNTCDYARQDRMRLKLGLAVLAKLVGLPISTLSYWERSLFIVPFEVERRITQTLTRISALLEAIPFPVDLGDVGWLESVLARWPTEEVPGISKEKLFQLAAQCRMKGWYGEERDEPVEFSPGPV